MSGYDCLNEKRFNSRRKVDSELVAATTSVGSVFQMCEAATAKARLPTVDSLTGGTTRPRLALVERSVRRPGNIIMPRVFDMSVCLCVRACVRTCSVSDRLALDC